MADILSDAIACIGFSWISSPACTELEMSMMNWVAKMLDLPEEFLFRPDGKGGGVIQGTASEASLVALLAARARAVKEQQEKGKGRPQGEREEDGAIRDATSKPLLL